MDKDEFYDSGCYSAFMWAWQHSSVMQNAEVCQPEGAKKS